MADDRGVLVTALRRDEASQRRCLQCGVDFTPASPSHRYCTIACRDIAAGLNPDREQAPYSRFCSMCGTHFEARRPDARMCSDACRQRLARRRRALRDRGEYVLAMLGDNCVYCGAEATGFDHITPVVAGGTDDWTNLAPCCGTCNSSKAARPLLAHLARQRERDALLNPA